MRTLEEKKKSEVDMRLHEGFKKVSWPRAPKHLVNIRKYIHMSSKKYAEWFWCHLPVLSV